MPRLLLALVILMVLISISRAGEQAVMQVFLNEEDQGDHIIIITDGDRLLISQKELLDMGFKEVPAGAQPAEEGYLYVDSLSGVRFEQDKKASVLRLTTDPGMFGKHTLKLSNRAQAKVSQTTESSGFLNYAFYYSAGEGSGFGVLGVPLEVGISSKGWLGVSNFNFEKTGTSEKFVRLMTSLTRDDIENKRRLVLGDVSATSGILGSAAVLGGVSISSNYTMDPFFIKYPGMPGISGLANTPSDLEIYSNNILIKKEHIPPGQFELLDLPNLTGRGDITLVIRDAFGREERITTPYYISTDLLAPGLQEYSYSLGFKREELGEKDFKYGSPAFFGVHRIGITPFFTGGLSAEADKDTLNAGASATFLVDGLGQMDTALAIRSSGGRVGYAFTSSFNYAGKYLSGRLSFAGFSREFESLPLPASVDKLRYLASSSLGYGEKTFGSLSASYSVADYYQGPGSKTLSVNYSRSLWKGISFNASYMTTEAAGSRTYQLSAGLMFLLGKETSGSIDYSLNDGSSSETIALQKNPPRGEGFGYNLSADRTKYSQDTGQSNAATGGQGFMMYRGPYGVYTADYMRIAGGNNYTLSAAGSVVSIDRSLHLSRPITDGFALVEVDNLANVSVKVSNQVAGVTGNQGRFIVPDILSYYPNKISINETDVPVNYSIKEIDKLVSVPYRGGGVVKFEVLKLQAFLGRLYIREKGKKTEAEYWGFELRQEERVIQAAVGKKGEFYMENIPAGKYNARLFLKDRECKFDLTIPKSDEPMVEMGEVICEMD